LFPVGRVILIDSWSRPQVTEEDVLRRTDDNSDVTPPDRKVAGLRLLYALKTFYSDVQIRGWRISIIKPGTFINGMHKVRAVPLGVPDDLAIKRRSDDRQTILGAQ